jgi:hypothetical protein
LNSVTEVCRVQLKAFVEKLNLNTTRASWLTVMVSMTLGRGILAIVYWVWTRFSGERVGNPAAFTAHKMAGVLQGVMPSEDMKRYGA